MSKSIFVKPICWNSKAYTAPSGDGAASGFVHDYGYGHEEWNNSPRRSWGGWKIFHTESPDNLMAAAKNGEVGLMMITMRNDIQWIVGLACNAIPNSEDEMKQIAADLDILGDGDDLWNIPLVKKRFQNDRNKFNLHWEKNHWWLRWRCHPDLFLWFPQPIEINPSMFTQKKRLAKMHGVAQATRPENVLLALDRYLPPSHPIRDWLTEGQFDEAPNLTDTSTAPTSKRKHTSSQASGQNATTDAAYVRFLKEQETVVDPKHQRLQAAFTKFLRDRSFADIAADRDYVDVRFTQDDATLVLCEIKPSEADNSRYQVRTAMGQLLDYRHRQGQDSKMLIVLGAKAEDDSISLAHTNGFGIAWPNDFGFEVKWP